MSTLLESRLFGFRVSLVAQGKYVVDLYLKCDSKCFDTATIAVCWALANC